MSLLMATAPPRDELITAAGWCLSNSAWSNYKSLILKKWKRGRKKAAVKPTGAAPVKAGKAIKGEISLEDVEAMKELVGRVGEANLMGLVEILK